MESKLTNFKNSPKFYIEQIISGHLTTNEINLTFNKEKENRVLINNLVPGTIKCHEDRSIDEYEIIMSEIADLFDINSATIYQITNEEHDKAIIVKDPNTNKELLISMDYIFKKLYAKFISQNNKPNHWMNAALNIPEATITNPIQDENQLKILLEMGINAALEAFKITDPEAFKTEYFSMLLFDYLTNQERRNAMDYFILANPNAGSAKLSPILFYKPAKNYPNLYYLNNRLVLRASLIKTIYHNYYPYIKEISRCLTNHHEAYLKSVKLICDYNSTTPNNIYETIKANIESIIPLDAECSGIVPMETKVDYTQTTIRINQRVMKKNLLYQNKYPEVKPEKTLVVENPQEDEERVKISIEEPEPVKSSGFGHTFLITSLIAFICGLGFGIAYIIIFLNK